MARPQRGAAPSANDHAATKKYVDDKIAALGKPTITFATGSEPSLIGVPDGTLWVEYAP